MDELRTKISPPDIRSGKDFGAFYNNFYPRFVHYAFYYVRDTATAEDIASNAILEYWVKKDSLKTDSDALGWMLTVVKNKCRYSKHLEVIQDIRLNTLQLRFRQLDILRFDRKRDIF